MQSAVDPLSFRDVMPLCFLTNQRMDNKNLLLEGQHMRNLKLVQVIEIVFGVYDDQIAAMGKQLECSNRSAAISLRRSPPWRPSSLREHVPGGLELERAGRGGEAAARRGPDSADALSGRMQAATNMPPMRERSTESVASQRQVGRTRPRSRDLASPAPPTPRTIRGGRAKLVFFQEADQLFDPLRVRVCPACMQELPKPVEIEAGGTCSLCNQHIPVQQEPVDITSERTAVRARLQAIDRYIEDVSELQLGEAQAEYQRTTAAEIAAQRRLDSQVGKDLSPFQAQRDELVRAREAIEGEKRDVARR